MKILPFDVLASIFHYLDPLDIIVFSQTCTAIHQVASTRDIWRDAFRSVCFQNGIFTAAFRIADISVLELQRITTSPFRMLKILQTEQNNQDHPQKRLYPFSKYTFKPSPILPMPTMRKPHTLYLVPGGRLLVAVSQSYITVLDLARVQEHGTDDADSKLFHRGRLMAISPTSTGDKIHIAASKQLTYSSVGNASSPICVWEYDPEKYSLEEIAATTLEKTLHLDLTMSCLAGNLFVYFNSRESTVNVWDFKLDLWATFTIPSTHTDLVDMMYDSGKIILIGYKCAAIWDVPAPHTFQRQRPPTPTDPVAPALQLMFDLFEGPLPIRNISIQGLETHRWGHDVHNGSPLLFDLITEEMGSQQVQLNVPYIHSPDQSSPPFYSRRFEDSAYDINQPCRLKQRYCQGMIFRTWHSLLSGTFYLSLPPPIVTDITPSQSALSLESEVPVISLVKSLRPMARDWLDYSFDPTSGRLCSVAQDGQITVVDYLSDPSRPLARMDTADSWTDGGIRDLDSDQDSDLEDSDSSTI